MGIGAWVWHSAWRADGPAAYPDNYQHAYKALISYLHRIGLGPRASVSLGLVLRLVALLRLIALHSLARLLRVNSTVGLEAENGELETAGYVGAQSRRQLFPWPVYAFAHGRICVKNPSPPTNYTHTTKTPQPPSPPRPPQTAPAAASSRTPPRAARSPARSRPRTARRRTPRL